MQLGLTQLPNRPLRSDCTFRIRCLGPFATVLIFDLQLSVYSITNTSCVRNNHFTPMLFWAPCRPA